MRILLRRAGSVVERPVVLFVALAVFYGAAVAASGRATAVDEANYSLWADTLLHQGVSLAPHYSGFVLTVLAAKLVAGDHWQIAIVALNIVAAAIAGALLVRIVERVTGRLAPAWAALVLYVACSEVLLWCRYAVPDSIFCALEVAMFSCIVHALVMPRPARWWVAAAALLVPAVAFRPSGVLLVPLFLLGALFAIWPSGSRPPVRLLAVIMIAVVVVAVWIPLDAQLFRGRPTPLLQPIVALLEPYFIHGTVIDGRPETYRGRPESMGEALALNCDRMLHFFQFESRAFSQGHNVANAFLFVPLYVLAAAAVVLLFAGRISGLQQKVAFLALAGAMTLAASRALTMVDFDWRYRLPAIPMLIIAAAIALDWMLGRFKARSDGKVNPSTAF